MNSPDEPSKRASPAGWTLFLDFDGVLNNTPFLRHQRNHLPSEDQRNFDPRNLTVLDDICRQLPVTTIVISSSWRLTHELEKLRGLLEAEGFNHAQLVRAATASGGISPNATERSQEIASYVALEGASAWIAIDDMDMGPLLGPRFFRTAESAGLTEQLRDAILDFAGTPP